MKPREVRKPVEVKAILKAFHEEHSDDIVFEAYRTGTLYSVHSDWADGGDLVAFYVQRRQGDLSYLWVEPTKRRRGFGTSILKNLGVRRVECINLESRFFFFF
jgi:hypothetical protein